MNFNYRERKDYREMVLCRGFDVDMLLDTDESNLWIDNQPASTLSSCE